MSEELSSILGSTIASLIKVGESSSPEEAGQKLEEGMNLLQSLKGDTPMIKLLINLGSVVGNAAKDFNVTIAKLHEKCNTSYAHTLYHDFMKDPQNFLESIPSDYRFDAGVTRELATAYGMRSSILKNTNPDEKLLGILTHAEILTIHLLKIREQWAKTPQ